MIISDKNVKLGYGSRRMVKYMDIGDEGLQKYGYGSGKILILSSSSTVYNLFPFPQCTDKSLGKLNFRHIQGNSDRSGCKQSHIRV
jgi:hypothetical protein